MRATLKYFWVVAALIVVQVGLGAVTAHYGVEGDGFYGIPLSKWLPYSVARTWHTQLGIFWIATAWLATGLVRRPGGLGLRAASASGSGVNFLFVCLLVIVVGSLAGEWLGVQQKLGFVTNFWFGHQGYEYVDLGRFWQIFLFVGLFLWLFLMVRALWPALREPGSEPAPAGAVRDRLGGDRAVLRRGPDVGPADAPGHGRVLALVGGAPLGRRLLRGLRHGGDRVPVHAHGPAADRHAPPRPCSSRRSSSWRAASSAPSTTSTSPARRPRCWRWARRSARWRSCRWC